MEMKRFDQSDIKYLACELPDEIKSYKFSGDFIGERREIGKYLGREGLPEALRRRLEIEDVIALEMSKDYLCDFDTLLGKIRKKYPACTPENLEHIIAIGNADYIVRGGERYFQRSAASNILNCNDRYLESVETGIMPQAGQNRLRHDNLRIMREKGYRAVRIRINEHLEVEPHARKEGKLIRVHLPFPALTSEQSDIVIHSTSHPVYISDYAQRTLFMEQFYRDGEVYFAEFSYTLKIPYFKPDPGEVSAEQPDFYLGEQLPQIRFTPLIRALADDLKGREKNPLILARRAYDWVTKNVVYSYMRHYLCIEQIPEFAILNRRGDCGVMALLFITLCRAMGVPARWQSGSHVRPTGIGSHDWAQYYVAPYGWLYCDPSFGGGAGRAGDIELWDHYACNLDVFREINCTEFQTSFDPPRRYLRTDPYDNQSGEAEYADEWLGFDDTDHGRRVVSFEDID